VEGAVALVKRSQILGKMVVQGWLSLDMLARRTEQEEQ
jgi:hypothetical protein